MSYLPVRCWLEEHTPLEPALLNGAALESLIAERLAAFGGNEAAYIAELNRSPDELDRLIAGIAVPETWLFRYPRSFDLLLGFLRARLAHGAPSLRMLSIGCATGQEPYCMAMTALHAGWPADRVRIEALDRNRDFLSAAARAEYSAASIRTEVPAWAVPFLHRSGDIIRIDSAPRALVHFERADVTGAAPWTGSGPYDAVFCRNLLIYLNDNARQHLLEAIRLALASDGLLFVGHAEQVIRGAAIFRPVNQPHAFALQVAGSASPAAEPAARAEPSTNAPSLPRPAPRREVAPRAASAASVAPPTRPTAAAHKLPSPPDGRNVSPPGPQDLDDARDLADAGQMHDAEAMIRAIIVARGPSAPALELLGMIRLSLDDVAGAKRLFEQALYLDPTRAASLLQLAIISERSGDAPRAAVYWDRARRPDARGQHEDRP